MVKQIRHIDYCTGNYSRDELPDEYAQFEANDVYIDYIEVSTSVSNTPTQTTKPTTPIRQDISDNADDLTVVVGGVIVGVARVGWYGLILVLKLTRHILQCIADVMQSATEQEHPDTKKSTINHTTNIINHGTINIYHNPDK